MVKNNSYVKLNVLLQNLIPAILDPEYKLDKGNCKEPLTGLSCKEALGLFIFTEVMNYSYKSQGEQIYFQILSKEFKRPYNDDGGVLIINKKAGGQSPIYFEQVSVTHYKGGDITDEILEQLNKKHIHYSDNKYYKTHSLIIFTNKLGKIDIKSVKDKLREETKFNFYALFYLGRINGQMYRYEIINLDPCKNSYSIFYVYILVNEGVYSVSDRILEKG